MDNENQNLNDTTSTKQSSSAEKVEKVGNATAKTVKTGKFLVKFINSLKTFGAFGYIGLIILGIIVAIVIIVGLIGFFLEMPGLITNKLSGFSKSIGQDLASIYFGSKAYIEQEDQKELAEYLENMGYSPYEYGFGQYMDKDGNFIDDENVDEDSTISSKYLNAYLAADYNTYVKEMKARKAVSDVLHNIRNVVGTIFGVRPDNQEAVFGMLKIDDSALGWLEDIETNPENKTLTVKMKPGLFSTTYYTFNMDGWTSRYGKPLELSITLHLATMAPDLVYRLDMDEKEDTKIHIGTSEKYTANIKFEYHITGDNITTDFASIDSDLSSLDESVANKKLTVDDLQKIKDAIEKYKQSSDVESLDAGYSNYSAFLNASIDDGHTKDYIKDDTPMIKRYDGSDAWYKNFLGTWYDHSIQNFFDDLDKTISKVKSSDDSLKFYSDENGKYGDWLGNPKGSFHDWHITGGGDSGMLKEYYDKRSELENDDDGLSDEDCEELLSFLQDKLQPLDEHIKADIDTIKAKKAENDQKVQDLYKQLENIGLTEDAINKAIDYNNDKGQGEGTDIKTVQPYIKKVTNHWYKDVIFVDDTPDAKYSSSPDDRFNAYGATNVSATYENVFNPADQSDDSALAPNDKGSFYTIETISGANVLTQVQDAIRGETNPHTKELFVGTEGHPAKYFVYDGSEKTAEKIDALRKVYNDAYNSSYARYWSEDTARQDAEDAVEAKEDEDGTNFYKEVNVRQNALSAFSMLENSKTEDSEYILRDLKRLFLDLGYFSKDDFVMQDTHVFQWPINGYINTYWPQRRFEKQQTDYGTLIRSKTSTDNIKAGLNADGSERTDSETQAYVYGPNYNADSTAASTDSGVPDLDDESDDTDENGDEVSNPTDTLVDGFESGLDVVSPVTGEILEEGNDYIKIKVLDTSAVSEYSEFYNEYKNICTGYIMYIKGFQKGTIDSSAKSEYQKVTHTKKYFIENGQADDFRDAEEVLNKFNEAEQKRVDAPAYLEVNGKRYIKEGTVIGTTTSSDIGLYLINRENSMVEDVESYVRLVKKGVDSEFPEKFIFWLGVKLEGGCEGSYDLGDSYGTTVLADGAGNTTAFGLTSAIANTGKVPEMYPNFAQDLASGRVPKKEAQDVFILVLEAARESILNDIDDQSGLSESMLDALVDLHHASPSECSQVVALYNQNKTLTIEDFENHWGTNTAYETQLRGRAYVRGALAENEEYRNPYNSPSYPEFTFNTETPWTDFIGGTPSSQIVSGG